TADGAPAGEYVVTVEWYKPIKQAGDVVACPNVIPRKYASPKTSPVVSKVAEGTTEFPPTQIKQSRGLHFKLQIANLPHWRPPTSNFQQGNPINETQGIHTCRAPGGDRHHRRARCPPASRRAVGARGGPAGSVHQRPQADRAGRPQ